ncbi:FRG domain-containing protein [Alteromonas oceani]|uniref:FRG domain-containing protein n=1 Tax=Alteromonas oceani TaxID=2071609 RepID=A0ABV7JWU3_9ALTE|nr:FRG domain-containing protein [Alteromonas oceani]
METHRLFDSYPCASEFEMILRQIEIASDSSAKIRLFRGQKAGYPLIPKVARKNPQSITQEIEIQLMREFRRQLAQSEHISNMNEWDTLVYGQHFGLATRLLDWTTNPLVATWFALKRTHYEKSEKGFLFILETNESIVDENTLCKSPFDIEKTRVLKPSLNNSRIIAQSGWFTVHANYKGDLGFCNLADDERSGIKISVIGISDYRQKIISKLNLLGVNDISVFPGPEGVANHINWEFNHWL